MKLFQQPRLWPLLALAALVSLPAFAQEIEWDTSGNSLLSGAHRFRDVVWITDNEGTDDLFQAVTQTGTITYDGAGNYSVDAMVWDSATSQLEPISYSGTYQIAANGYGFIDRGMELGGDLYGGVAGGVFSGSPVESAINGLFISAPSSSNTTNASFNGNYAATYMNFPTLRMSDARDGGFFMSPAGAGTLPVINLSGYIGGDFNERIQVISNASYNFADGVGTLSFGGVITENTILAGNVEIYGSPDGEFFFGGHVAGWDMMLIVKGPAEGVQLDPFSGLYYQTGVDLLRTELDQFFPQLDTYYGGVNAVNDVVLGHQRLLVAPDVAAFDYTYSEDLDQIGNGLIADVFGNEHIFSASQKYRIGWGRGDYLGVHLALRIPSFSGDGPFISPVGVLNAASFAPFTAGLSRGAVATVFGNGLADEVLTDGTFPTTLGGVQVFINDRLAPIYVVAPGQVSFVIPYDTELPVADIRLVKNGVESNRVTFYMNQVSPGVFTLTANGVGLAAALHADYTLVDQNNPARPGETIAVYLTGLGEVNPPVAAGTPGPIDPLSLTTSDIRVQVDGFDAPLVYSGLAPTLGGLYQINITIPQGVFIGDVFLEISGPDAFSSQVLLPIGNAAAGEASADPRSARAADAEPEHTARPSKSGRTERVAR